MTQNSELVLNFLKRNYGKEFSKQEIANALNISVPSVVGSMNSLIKKGYAITTRVDEKIEVEATDTRKAKIKNILFHTLTEAGLAYDPVAEAEQKAAEKTAEKERKAAERAAKKAEKEANA